VWRATLDLPQSTHYEYRYLIDGQWKTDSHADGFANNSHGSENSVVNATLPVVILLGRTNHKGWSDKRWDGPNLAPSSAMNTLAYPAR
jgi:hypothetical protein